MPDTFDSLRPRIIDYLYDRGIDPRKRFRCLNPAHLDRDPSMGFDPKRNKVHCFACGADYDLFDLLALDNNLPPRRTPFLLPANGTETAPHGVPSPSAPPNPPP